MLHIDAFACHHGHHPDFDCMKCNNHTNTQTHMEYMHMHIDRRYACGLPWSITSSKDWHKSFWWYGPHDPKFHTLQDYFLSPHLPGIEVKAIDGGFDTALKVGNMVFPWAHVLMFGVPSWWIRGNLWDPETDVRNMALFFDDPETNMTLKMNGWNTIVSFWDSPFSGAILVSGGGKYLHDEDRMEFWYFMECTWGMYTTTRRNPDPVWYIYIRIFTYIYRYVCIYIYIYRVIYI